MKMSGRIVSSVSIFFLVLLLTPLVSRAQMRRSPIAQRPVLRSVPVRPSPTHGLAVPRARINTAAPRPMRPVRARVFVPPANAFGNQFSGGSGETLQQLLDPVPGQGFDYAHIAALDRDLAIRAVIDPQTQWRLAVAERVSRDTSGFATPGYYLLDGGGAYIMPGESTAEQQPQQSQPPQIIVLQQSAQKSAEESTPAAAPQPEAPIPDVGDFTLVLQSGKKIQAIAFTRFGDQIVYITADGQRHAIASSNLDAAATQRVNEEKGTQLTL
jgi:hypothetical protein